MSNITVLVGSQRIGGNTDILANAFCDAAKLCNKVEILSVAQLKVNPCKGCNSCYDRGTCCVEDDMQKVYDVLADTDILVIASPVYFYGISGQLKAIIDRLHSPQRNHFHLKKLGLLLVAADSKPQVFDSIKVQYQLALDYFNLESIGEICVGGVREKGSIQGNDALEKARRLGKSLKN